MKHILVGNYLGCQKQTWFSPAGSENACVYLMCKLSFTYNFCILYCPKVLVIFVQIQINKVANFYVRKENLKFEYNVSWQFLKIETHYVRLVSFKTTNNFR